MIKKYGIALLSFIVLVCGIAFVACKNTKSVKLIDWQNKSITVKLGDEVRVDSSAARDEDGNSYAVRADVTQSDGKAVMVFNDVFTADYAGGYKIEYSLVDSAYQAEPRIVTVVIENSDVPQVYFSSGILNVFENEEFAVPEYNYSLNPSIAVSKTSLSLYKIQGENRTEIEFSSTSKNITLAGGNYVFVAEVITAENKSGSAELNFRVRPESERGAIASMNCVEDERPVFSYYDSVDWNYHLANTIFTPDVKRNEFVSEGSVKVSLPATATVVTPIVAPQMTVDEFVDAAMQENSVISVWVYMEDPLGNDRTAQVADETVTLREGAWTNICIDIDKSGGREKLVRQYYGFTTKTGGLFSISNAAGTAFDLYFDSIYIATPLNATFSDVTVNYGEEVKLVAESEATDDFYYELYDGTKNDDFVPQIGNGEFVARAAGKIMAKAYPRFNRYISDVMIAEVTVNYQDTAFQFENTRYEYSSGIYDLLLPQGSLNDLSYRITTEDGSEVYSYIQSDKMRLFSGNQLLYAYGKKDDVNFTCFTYLSVERAAAKSGEIENFDDIESLGKNTDKTLSSFMGDFKGAYGVVKFNVGAGIWPTIRFHNPLNTLENLIEQGYDENDVLAIRFYMENVPAGYGLNYHTAAGDNVFVANIAEGWQTLYIDAKVIFDDAENWLSTGESHLVFTNNQVITGEIYLDYIRFEKCDDPIASDNETCEYQNFSNADSVLEPAKNGFYVQYFEEFEGATGVMRFFANNQQWPVIKGIAPRLTKEEYNSLGYGENDKFIIRVFNAKEGLNNYKMFYSSTGKGDNDKNAGELKYGWNELEISAGEIFNYFDNWVNGVAYIGFTNQGIISHDIYIDAMYFKKSIETEIVNNKLYITNRKDGAVYKLFKDGVCIEENLEDGYDLLQYAEEGSWSEDIAFIVKRYDEAGKENCSQEFLYSTPAGAMEINGFGSSAAAEKVPDHAPYTGQRVAQVTDNKGVTEYGVYKLDFTVAPSPWPGFTTGNPMRTKAEYEQSGVNFSGGYYVVFRMYFEGDISNLTITYRDNSENKELKTFAVQSGWTDYKVPVELIDFDKFASGTQRFGTYKNGVNVLNTVYIDAVWFEAVN